MLPGGSPNWDPLVGLVGEEVTAEFMWMFEVAMSDGRRLHAYRHIVTRGYVHLDEEGHAFYVAGTDDHTYRPVAHGVILEAVLSPWWSCASPAARPEPWQPPNVRSDARARAGGAAETARASLVGP